MAILKGRQVIDSWSVLISGAKGKAEDIFRDTEEFIKKSGAPNIQMKRRTVSPGIFKRLLGKKREFLVVTEKDSMKLKPFQMFINARDYGNNLDVCWYLTYRIGIKQMLTALFVPLAAAIQGILMKLDLFDQQDLRAYVTNAHHCLLEAVEKLMVSLNQDPSKIDRKSRGFLGIS